MPIYDFKCRECGKVAEKLVRNSDNKKIICPDCGSGNMEKLISSSYLVKTASPSSSATCCGRAESCDTPPCDSGGKCCQH
jgi:putative FmdB family regulatory protein